MRWARFDDAGAPRYGLVEGDTLRVVEGNPFAGHSLTDRALHHRLFFAPQMAIGEGYMDSKNVERMRNGVFLSPMNSAPGTGFIRGMHIPALTPGRALRSHNPSIQTEGGRP